MNVAEYNRKIVLREAKDMAGLLLAISELDNSPNLIVSMIKFACFYVNELIKYFGYPTDGLLYLKAYNETRSKMKPFKDASSMKNAVDKYCDIAFNHFVMGAPPFFRLAAPDIGLCYCNGRLISNTIGIHMENSHYMGKNITVDKKRIVDMSREVGEILVNIANGRSKIKFVNKIQIATKDCRFMSDEQPLFRSGYNTRISLIYLNALCALNFCRLIVFNNNCCRELKARVCFLILNKTLADLSIVNDILPVNELNDVIFEYNLFFDKSVRDCMFHLDFSNDLVEENFSLKKLFGGLVEALTALDDNSFIKKIKECQNVISSILVDKVVERDYVAATPTRCAVKKEAEG